MMETLVVRIVLLHWMQIRQLLKQLNGLNEVTENIRNNTYVKSVDASTNASSGGNPLSVTLTISSMGITQMDIQLIGR